MCALAWGTVIIKPALYPLPPPSPRVQFKARPLNPKIFQPGYQGLCGVVREEMRAPTRPVAPKLATAEREAKRKQTDKAQDQPCFVFKALDLPKGMLEGVKVTTCSTALAPQGMLPSHSSAPYVHVCV